MKVIPGEEEGCWVLIANNGEKALAHRLASERCNFKSGLGIATGRIDQTRSNEEITYLGFLAEILVCRILEVPFQNLQLFPGQDDGVDLVWRGFRIQVKASYYPDGNLIVKNAKHLSEKKPYVADVFLLVTPVKDQADCFQCSYIHINDALPLIERVEFQPGSGIQEIVRKEFLKPLAKLIYEYYFQK